MHSFHRRTRMFFRCLLVRVLLLALCLAVVQTQAFAQATATAPANGPQAVAAPQQGILPFIKGAWNTLGRSMNECSSISDPKFGAGATSVIYLPYGVTPPPQVAALSKCGVKVENLPKKITGLGTIPVADLNAHGLLYLPNKYVVPGGRFNEMYGWDSYFIIVGLLEDGERDYSRGIIENFFLRDRELRRGAQRQSRLLPHALATPVSHLDDHGPIRR